MSDRRKYKTVVGMRTESGASFGLAILESEEEEFTERELETHKNYINAVMTLRGDSVLRIDGEGESQVFVNPEHIAYVSVYPID